MYSRMKAKQVDPTQCVQKIKGKSFECLDLPGLPLDQVCNYCKLPKKTEEVQTSPIEVESVDGEVWSEESETWERLKNDPDFMRI